MTMVSETILVTGGSGVLGAAVVRRLLDTGRPVRVLSRRPQRAANTPEKAEWAVGDLATGAGLAEALDGVGVVVNCASDTKGAGKTDETATRHLVEAAQAAGSPHVVHVSIVGIDLVPVGYYKAKLAAERLLQTSGLPYTVLRATQFHDLVLAGVQQLARLPVVPVPSGALVQSVEVGEVADRLAELALGEPVGRAPDLGGPKVWSGADLVRAVLRASGRRRSVLPLPLPGKAMKALRAGGLLVREGGSVGRRGFDDFLAAAPLGDRTYGAAQAGDRAALKGMLTGQVSERG
ncbi:SDR family oxidoreductase [Actinacidiphila soli]|uniref:SDR family oxidoreductase n=1 Tax=Actinacidiphila soli TaxID=2487275 RepID=UPI0019D248FE|nr:NAD(P)H-binding protein [Actinacidiphila soli]